MMADMTEMASPRIDLERPGLTPEMKERNRISRAQKLYEKTAVAPPPSKDFYEVLVTELGVVLRWWKITVRQRQKAAPGEMVASWENFQDDKRMQEEIERIFGLQVKEDTLRLVNGHLDWLSRLPSDVFVNVATFLDLPSIAKLSQVNSHFKVMCNLDRLWEKLYEQHSGGPDKVPEEVRKIASEVGWKKVYFTNKLQLRMQVGRMRQKSASKGYNQSHQVETFVTQH